MSTPQVLLASASPRRKTLLQELDVDFQVLPGHAPEVDGDHLTPREVAQVNAYRKARVIAKKHPDALVLGADTVVALGSQVYGKPATHSDAQRMLEALQGREHEVVTGVCLISLRMHRQKIFVVSTRVLFRKLTPDEIRNYLRRIDPLDKAGGYAIQEHGDMIVSSIDGSLSNVVGLPLERLREELRNWTETGPR